MSQTRTFLIFSVLLAGILLSGACVAVPLGVPLIKGVTVDGNPSDWGSAGFCINLFADSKGRSSVSLNAKDTVRLGWDKRGLLALFQVSDPTPNESQEVTLWQGASVELLMADRVGGRNSYHLLISPGISAKHPSLRFYFYDNRTDSVLKPIPLTQISARKATKTGYVVEVLLPWKNLGIKPEIGMQLGLQVMINHLDSAGNSGALMWFPKPGADGDTTLMYSVRLSRKADRDRSFITFADADKIWPERIAVVGDARLAGRKVTALSGSALLSQSTMRLASGRSVASLAVPVAERSQGEEPATVVVEGNGSMTITRTDAFQNAQHIIDGCPLVFSPFVFSGTAFPAGDFENASQIHSQIGDYRITRRFFNSDYKEVTTANRPGRYGAIVNITTSEKGPSVERYVTLFRQKDTVGWHNMRLRGTLEMQEGMLADFNIGKDEKTVIIDLARKHLPDTLSKYQYGAIMMSGLSESTTTSARPLSWNDALVLDDHWWYGLLKKLNKDTLYHYSAFLPKDYSADNNRSWPLLIALHGTGDSEHTVQQLIENSAYTKMLKYTSEKCPMITVIPHCSEDQMHWSGVLVKELIESVSRRYRVDPKRIYLTGYSMGGYGTYATAIEYPDLFAAVAPVCGWSDPEDAARLQHVPVWAFHGDADPLVPWEMSHAMVDTIRKAGGETKWTLYPGFGHNSWDAAFGDPALYEWFLSHSK